MLDYVSHTKDAAETTVVFKNMKNSVFLTLPSALGKISPNKMYTELPGQVTADVKPLYCLDVVSPARVVT